MPNIILPNSGVCVLGWEVYKFKVIIKNCYRIGGLLQFILIMLHFLSLAMQNYPSQWRTQSLIVTKPWKNCLPISLKSTTWQRPHLVPVSLPGSMRSRGFCTENCIWSWRSTFTCLHRSCPIILLFFEDLCFQLSCLWNNYFQKAACQICVEGFRFSLEAPEELKIH